jgi:hypothetical protein
MDGMRRAALLVLLAAAAACGSNHAAAPSAKPATTTPAFDAASALRPGTTVQRTIEADMDGDGTDEVAVWSEATTAPAGSVLRQSYVDVYGYTDGRWTHVFDASGSALAVDPRNVSQHVVFMRFVTFAHKPDLVLGVLNEGAGAGPLDVWIWSWGRPFKREFRYSTTQGGTLATQGKTVTLDTGAFEPTDPMCCPSGMDHIVIGIKDGSIGIVGRTTTKS